MLVRAHDACPDRKRQSGEPLPQPIDLLGQLRLAGARALDDRRRAPSR